MVASTCPSCRAAVDHGLTRNGRARCQWCDHTWEAEPRPEGDCPSCQAAMNTDLIVDGQARCQWCDHTWAIGPTTADRGPPAAPEPPGHGSTVHCPTCQAAPDALEAAGDLMRCTQCEHVWVRSVAEPPPPPQAPVMKRAPKGRGGRARRKRRQQRITARPPTVRLVQLDDEVVVRIPWRQRAGMIVHGFYLMVLACLLGAAFEGEPVSIEMLFAIAFLVIYVYMLVNATEVRIRPDVVSVRHGPLPSPKDPHVEVRVSALATLTVRTEEMHIRGRYGGTTTVEHYTLVGGGQTLLRKFADEDTVDYVAQLIAATVDHDVEVVYTG